jgi:hypothetical protein
LILDIDQDDKDYQIKNSSELQAEYFQECETGMSKTARGENPVEVFRHEETDKTK